MGDRAVLGAPAASVLPGATIAAKDANVESIRAAGGSPKESV